MSYNSASVYPTSAQQAYLDAMFNQLLFPETLSSCEATQMDMPDIIRGIETEDHDMVASCARPQVYFSYASEIRYPNPPSSSVTPEQEFRLTDFAFEGDLVFAGTVSGLVYRQQPEPLCLDPDFPGGLARLTALAAEETLSKFWDTPEE